MKIEGVEIPDDVAKLVDWIPKRRYIQLVGESDEVIKKRIAAGYWQKGVHYDLPGGSRMWISLRAVNEWANPGKG